MKTENSSEEQSTVGRKLRKWLKSLVVYGFLLLLISHGVDFYRLSQLETQQVAPALLQQLKAQLSTQQQQNFADGDALLVYVWASWCGVCRTTSAAVSHIAEDHPVATVALKSGEQAEVDAYLTQKTYVFSALADTDGRWTKSLETHATPSFFIVNTAGDMLYYSVGINTEPSLRAKMAFYSQVKK
ncbi:MAG: redoxin family protein [Pseudomonadales bacterium]|nr:redoxin family protein [Pseudomonadales bacterium]